MSQPEENPVFSPGVSVLMETKHLTKHYLSSSASGVWKKEKKKLHALDDVSISLREGEFFGVVGESGCGKSTLGRCLLRLIEPTSGQVFFNGEEITHKVPSGNEKNSGTDADGVSKPLFLFQSQAENRAVSSAGGPVIWDEQGNRRKRGSVSSCVPSVFRRIC